MQSLLTLWFSKKHYTSRTAQKMKFTINDFFSKCDQIPRKLRIWSHLLMKSLMENFILCAVSMRLDNDISFKNTRWNTQLYNKWIFVMKNEKKEEQKDKICYFPKIWAKARLIYFMGPHLCWSLRPAILLKRDSSIVSNSELISVVLIKRNQYYVTCIT